ncbi:MAG: histidine phosphatase family protein [Pseudomonadota bacterium]|nr:histidine phosphatase family protein [Pseudomonadota bacterium]
MAQVTLVRHGQANSASNDEHGYDKLSDLGWQQTEWLGSYFGSIGERFERVYSGTLIRHRETAQSMGFPEPIQDARLNEVAYFDLSAKMHAQLGIKPPVGREEFIEHLPLVFTAWREGQIKDTLETYAQFEDRVDDVLHEIAAGDGPALVCTSGGWISMAIKVAMGLQLNSMARLALTIMNSSVHQLHPVGAGLTLTQFNAVPHLADPDRQYAQTFI